jgi:hypothetical protein
LRSPSLSQSTRAQPLPMPLPSLPHVRPLEILIAPDFSQIEEKRELKFEAMTNIEFDQVSRELRPDVLWFADARKYVYSSDQIKEFMQKEVEQSEFPFIRFVVNNDMSLMLASNGQPSATIPSHGQMTQYNSEAIVGGSIKRRIEDQRMIIEGGDNQSSGLKSDFNKIQLAFILLMQSDAYKNGLVLFDETKELIFIDANPASKKVYYTTAVKLIAQLEDLARIYAKTILTPEKLAEYASKNGIFTTIEVPGGMLEKEYIQTTAYQDLIEESARAYRARSSSSSSTTSAAENTPFRRQPPPTPSRRRTVSSAPNFSSAPATPVLPGPLAAITARLSSAPYPNVFLHDSRSPFKPAPLKLTGLKREGDEDTIAKEEGERQRPRK